MNLNKNAFKITFDFKYEKHSLKKIFLQIFSLK